MYDITALDGHGHDLARVSDTLDAITTADTHTAETISSGLCELADLITQLGRVLAL